MEVASIGSFEGFITFTFVALSIGTLNEVSYMTIYEIDHVLFSDNFSDGAKLEVRSKFGVVADRACVEPLADVSIEYRYHSRGEYDLNSHLEWTRAK